MENTSSTSLNTSPASEANPPAITRQIFEDYKAAVKQLYDMACDRDSYIKKYASRRNDAISKNAEARAAAISRNTFLRSDAISRNTRERDSAIHKNTFPRDSAIRENASMRDNRTNALSTMERDDRNALHSLKVYVAELLPESERASLVTERKRLQEKLDGSRLAPDNKLCVYEKSWDKEKGYSWGCTTTIIIVILSIILGIYGCTESMGSRGGGPSIGDIFSFIIVMPLFSLAVGYVAGFIFSALYCGLHNLIVNLVVDSRKKNNARIREADAKLDRVKGALETQKSLDDKISNLRRKGRLVDFSSMLLQEAEYEEKAQEIASEFSKRKKEIEEEFSKKQIEIVAKFPDRKNDIEAEFSKKRDDIEAEFSKESIKIDKKYSEEKDAICREFDREKKEIDEKHETLWAGSRKKLSEFASAIANAQPSFKEFILSSKLKNPGQFPSALVIGDVHIERKQEKFSTNIPNMFSFPFPQALLGTAKTPLDYLSVIIWRMLVSLPVGGLHFTVCDPLKSGASFRDFLTLTNAGETLLTSGKALVDPADITAGIAAEDAELTTRTQQHLSNVASWKEYNRKNPEMPLPYRVLLVFDAPEAISSESRDKLAKLIKSGPSSGILPVLIMKDNWQADSRGRKNDDVIAWMAGNEKHLRELKELAPEFYEKFDNSDAMTFSSDPVLPALPQSQKLKEDICKKVVDLYTNQKKQTHPIDALWEGKLKPEWEDDTVPKFLDIPLGWRENGQPAVLRIGGDKPHTLLAGRTGSGKTNLMHVLLLSLAHHYSPEQVRVFLLDYKQGAGLPVYEKHNLPHAMLVATESDVEFGVSVLQRIEKEIARREKFFKDENIDGFSDQAKIPKEKRFPRWLCVIDEFHMLFGEDRANAAATEKLLKTILTQGRSAGLHVILSTQTLQSLSGTGFRQMEGQIANRLCLKCDPTDSETILGNPGASLLKGQPEALLTDTFGAPMAANVKFLVPLADKMVCEKYLKPLREHADATGREKQAPRVFKGEHQPDMPGAEEFAREAAGAKTPVLLLGRQLNYEEELLSCKLQRRAGSNLLCVGGGEGSAALRRDLLRSLARSVSAARGEVLLMALRDEDEQVDLSGFLTGVAGLRNLPSAPTAELAAALELPEKRLETPRFLIIDGFDFAQRIFSGDVSRMAPSAAAPTAILPGEGFVPTPARALSPSDIAKQAQLGAILAARRGEGIKPTPAAALPPPAPLREAVRLTPAAALKKYLVEGPEKSCWTIVFGDDWKRLWENFRDLMKEFDLLVGYCMSEDNAGSFFHDSIKGLEKANRAFFKDGWNNKKSWFRPFKVPSQEADREQPKSS